MRAIELAHLLVQQTLKSGDWVVDATTGNGHDTLWLAPCVGTLGRVYGFDVQEAALASAAQRVLGLPQVTLIHSGHETLAAQLPPEARGRIAAVMFNLGFLPGASKAVTTKTDTTLAALGQALDFLAVGGRITLVLYPGHPGGDEEAAAVRAYARRLPATYAASHYARVNSRKPAPELVHIERLT
jgi:predicted methyltransferase